MESAEIRDGKLVVRSKWGEEVVLGEPTDMRWKPSRAEKVVRFPARGRFLVGFRFPAELESIEAVEPTLSRVKELLEQRGAILDGWEY
ncbi:MAG: hypothetical protein QXJ59_07610, partial [Thermofilaceae archaeon]